MRIIPHIVPLQTLDSISKLVLVVPAAEGMEELKPWATDVHLVIAAPAGRVLSPIPKRARARGSTLWPPPMAIRVTVVAENRSWELDRLMQSRPGQVDWIRPVNYFQTATWFSGEETAALCPPTTR
jgi:hypothetical protein